MFINTRHVSFVVAGQSRQSEMELRVANYSGLGVYRRYTSGKDFPCILCVQNSGDVSDRVADN